MKKLGLVIAMLSASAPVFAANGINPGSSLTTGPSSSQYSIFAAGNNPAMAPLMVSEGEHWRINYLPSISFDAELGEVSNFADDLEELIDIIDDPSLVDSPEETLDRFNDVLVRMGEDGYIKNSVNVSIPVAPLYFSSERLGGTVYVDVNFGAQVSLRVLDRPLFLASESQSFTTDTSIYLKSGIEKKVAVGYGRKILEDNAFLAGKGTLYVGAKLNFYSMELSKQIIRIEDLDGQEVSDVIQDEYDSNLTSSSGVGLDLGLVWDADWYRIGARITDLNSPSFSYGAVGVNCEQRPENTVEHNSCRIAQSFVDEGRLASHEEHTKHALLSVDGLLAITDRWHVTSSFDLAEYDDVVGYENQWWNIATSYDTKGRFLPDWRLGYKSNLAGTKTNAFMGGVTLFNVVSLDLEYSTESVEVDGTEVPRRLGFSLAFEESF